MPKTLREVIETEIWQLAGQSTLCWVPIPVGVLNTEQLREACKPVVDAILSEFAKKIPEKKDLNEHIHEQNLNGGFYGYNRAIDEMKKLVE